MIAFLLFLAKLGLKVFNENCLIVFVFFFLSVYAEILDRNQQHLAMVQIPVAFFVPINLPANQLLTITEGSPMIEVLAEESNDIWINVRHVHCKHSF